MPSPANLKVLIEWLDLKPDEIFINSEDKPSSQLIESINVPLSITGMAQSAKSTLDFFSPRTVVLDLTGRIVLVNDAWRIHPSTGRPSDKNSCCEGVNYLDVCKAVSGPDKAVALNMIKGITEVSQGIKDEYELKYVCLGDPFIARVTTHTANGNRLVVVTHQAISQNNKTND